MFPVRDAAARLPNGEGTRGDICELLKDSQFLAPAVTETQVRALVLLARSPPPPAPSSSFSPPPLPSFLKFPLFSFFLVLFFFLIHAVYC